MRVTIAVEGVQREIEVRPDLLLPGMGEWQDATEMDLLRAFGSAYKEAVAIGVAAAEAAAAEAALVAVAGSEPDAVEGAAAEVAPEVAEVVALDLDGYDPEEAPEETTSEEVAPFAEAPVAEFAPAQPYIADAGDVEAFLSPVVAQAVVVPEVTTCRCGHAVAWHATEAVDQTGPCLMAWPIDEHDPQGPSSRCSCLVFEPADVRPPTA